MLILRIWSFGSLDRSGRDHEGPAALLARQLNERSYPASCQVKWHQQGHRLAYIPAFRRHVAEGRWGGCQDRPRAPRHAKRRITLDVARRKGKGLHTGQCWTEAVHDAVGSPHF